MKPKAEGGVTRHVVPTAHKRPRRVASPDELDASRLHKSTVVRMLITCCSYNPQPLPHATSADEG